MTTASPEARKRHNQTYYEKNREIIYAGKVNRRRWRRAFVAKVKLDRGCNDCGYAENAEALDFDHVDGSKSGNVSVLVANGWGLRRIMAEIDKCEVVCANCHRIRTAARRSGSSSRRPVR